MPAAGSNAAAATVKSNVLKGRRFDSLQELNSFLVHWNHTWALVCIHGTTRRQVFAQFEETDKEGRFSVDG